MPLELANDIEAFAKSILKGYKAQTCVSRKVIHDPILGTNAFDPCEVGLIDLPFCQRLRTISQTDVASLVYPSSGHNRLEHSLGVATIAGRILQSLRDKGAGGVVDTAAALAVRAAAILHDIGQGPFSHLSDRIIKDFPEVREYRSRHRGKFSEDKPHEMLSYLILKSPSFKSYFESDILSTYKCPDLSSAKIADMVVAASQKDQMSAWQGDVINGPFDADKLDYLQRDAYFSGLRIGIDLDRFLHAVWLNKESTPRRLRVMSSGAITLEQILFGKVLLYNTMYHHQKVLAAECAVLALFEILKDNPSYKINGRNMSKAVDFLHVTEHDLLSLDDKPAELRLYVQRLLRRDLPKRALVISAETVDKPHISTGYAEFKDLAESPAKTRGLRKKIVEALNGKYPIYDIWVVLPKASNFQDEASMAKIQDPGGPERSLREPFRVDEWLTAYWKQQMEGLCLLPGWYSRTR